jgi:hypothetical protein
LKIYVLPVHHLLQPPPQSFLYPSHNIDYGVEQDFLIWLNKNPALLTTDVNEANWHYLPVFWTRWHINHDFADQGSGLSELKSLLTSTLVDDQKTFTITQFDGGTLIDLGKTVTFTAARTINDGIDIPILCELHQQPLFKIRKKFLASFNGSKETHPLRAEIFERFKGNSSINLGGNLPTRFLKRWIQGKQFNLNILASYISLCPRGTSANSFRFFESMQLGIAPCLIGDIDARPFKKFINWDEISYYVTNVDELEDLLKNFDKNEAIKKGKAAKHFFKSQLFYQKWCKYVIKELNEFSTP